MATTITLTAAGFAAIQQAGSTGPLFDVEFFQIGSTVITASPNMTGVTGFVYQGTRAANQLKYFPNAGPQLFQYVLTMDTLVGNFTIANIGLFTGAGVMLAILAFDPTEVQPKFATSGSTPGNNVRITFPINMIDQAVVQYVNIVKNQFIDLPELSSELALPAAAQSPYNAYKIDNLSQFGLPAIAVNIGNNWFYIPLGQSPMVFGGTAYPTNAEIGVGPVVGSAVYFDAPSGTYLLADSSNLGKGVDGILDIGNRVVFNGIYKTATPTFVTGTKYYADGAANAGKLTTVINSFFVGTAIDTETLVVKINPQPIDEGLGPWFVEDVSNNAALLVTTVTQTLYTASATNPPMTSTITSLLAVNFANSDQTITVDYNSTSLGSSFLLESSRMIPAGGEAVELLRNPKVLSPGDSLSAVASVNGAISLLATIVEYPNNPIYFPIPMVLPTAIADFYVPTAQVLLQSIQLTALSNDNVTVALTDSSNNVLAYLANNTPVYAGTTLDLVSSTMTIKVGQKLRAFSTLSNNVHAVAAFKTR